ncbi:MAG: dephospho-CoA kinase [Anaerolineae bacterium]|nr:dephospho-CoA kinase [Anaerolineae bacterium]
MTEENLPAIGNVTDHPSSAADSPEVSGDCLPYRIGLTGNIATGKSNVGKLLRNWGAAYIDADKVAHEMMLPGAPAYQAVVAHFGEGILAPDGSIDRRALGAIVFSDPAELRRLEQLVHPATIAEVERRIRTSGTAVVVVEAIKLLESGMAETYDAIWVTTCTEAEQVHRLENSRGLTRAEALRRIHAQPPQTEKLARADVIIDTGGAKSETRAQALVAWEKIPRCGS